MEEKYKYQPNCRHKKRKSWLVCDSKCEVIARVCKDCCGEVYNDQGLIHVQKTVQE